MAELTIKSKRVGYWCPGCGIRRDVLMPDAATPPDRKLLDCFECRYPIEYTRIQPEKA